MTDTLEIARKKLNEYNTEIRTLETRLAGLKTKRDQLKNTIEFLMDELETDALRASPAKERHQSELQLRDKILTILKEAAPAGLKTSDLVAALKDRWPDDPFKPSSVSTNLSLLGKRENKIRRDEDKKWRFGGKKTRSTGKFSHN